jgi:two-component system, cell cycle response regulator DivK
VAGESILIVDDNAQNVKLLRYLLAGHGYDVKTAIDAEHALLTLETYTPRVILMDVQLPGMDGLELTRRLKHDPQRSGVIIIALTAYAMKGDRERALAAGCDAYVAKPIDTDALPQMIADLIAAGGGP